ncbi:hypothetical protein [Ferruginibacter sp. HRS2-29]|uniref:DUF3108 domain-containing protein n=1 Tax=Ferruginibacter sp. HRS2-29 TaxID=2487334 RepID=UPI0020CEFA85|nr:hypothetical protein [Ferruginibacter sp. HRS2-29]
MKLFLKTVASVIVAFAGISTYAQTKLEPGKNSFEAKWIVDEQYNMKWYAVKDTMKIEVATIGTNVVKGKKNVTIVTEVKMKSNPAPWIDSAVADITTLEPIMHSSYNPQRDMGFRFGKIVKGFYNDKIKKTNTVVSDTMAAPYFDSNIYPALVRWLPLSEGYTCNIPIYDYRPDKSGLIYAYVKKVESGTYTAKDGRHKVWLVTVHDEISNDAGSYSVFSIDKADRKLWQQEIVMTGRKMVIVRE